MKLLSHILGEFPRLALIGMTINSPYLGDSLSNFFFFFFCLSSDFDANNIFKAFFGGPGGFSFEGEACGTELYSVLSICSY